MENISNEIINKLEYACTALINELLIIKHYEDSNGNINKYKWLDILNTTYSDNNINPILKVISKIFDNTNNDVEKIITLVVSEYFSNEDLNMLRKFMDNYYIHLFNIKQEDCSSNWYNNHDPLKSLTFELHSKIIFEIAISFYMKICPKFVKNILLNTPEQMIQLK